ncbi:MAG: methyltransferase domain-containing protein [Candidatus Heimdallarchaeota archaeon]|nr:methyltransferase domain-containing protein [Candidatus Heimdallarchaeota archaeon]MCK4291273.1 methyltransferase domain-containing protein [Candidatus Heimdallarchaeota archaeon]
MSIFSKMAHRYDKFVGKFNLDEIIEYLPLDSENLLLDLGGGTGRAAEQLQEHVNECIVLDPSYEMLSEAKKKTDRFLIVQAVGEALPFRENSLKQIFLNDSLHHIKKQKETLEESFRVLKPGGKLIIREFDKSYFWNIFLRFAEFIVGFGSKFHSPKKLAAMCEEIGFKTSWERPNRSTFILIAEK